MANDQTDITADPTRRVGDLGSGATHSFQQKRNYHAHLLEVEGTHFHADSPVLLPEPISKGRGSERGETITGLSILSACYRHSRQHPEHRILIVGHAKSDEEDAQQLSERRAHILWYALQGDRQAWAEEAHPHSVGKDVQKVLRWGATAHGWNCDPESIDENEESNTTRAVQHFQQRYNEEFDRSITVDGTVGEETWGAIFDVYMTELRRILGTDTTGLEAVREGLAFLPRSAIGGGANYPVPPGRREKYRNPSARRVEILFFAPGEEPPGDTPERWCEALYRDT